MATTQKVHCDGPGCEKEVGVDCDMIRVMLQHEIGSGAVPKAFSASTQTLISRPLEFCSYDHAIAWMEKFDAEELKTARDRRLKQLKLHASTHRPEVPVGPYTDPSI